MDVLDRILDLPPGSDVAFIPADSFQGRKAGMVFKNGQKGLGYYGDQAQVQQLPKKRGREFEIRAEPDDDDEEGWDGQRQTTSIDIKRLVDEAEEVKALDVASLKTLLLKFEKRINHNQEQRIKYPQAPEKFMDSEIELHATLAELQAVTASPELFPTLLQNSSLELVLGLVTHDNVDISLSAISLLQELTDSDEDEEQQHKQFVTPVVDRLLKLQCLELVVTNLDRLDDADEDASEDDTAGVFSTMSLVENLVGVQPSSAALIGERTPLLSFLVRRLQPRVTGTSAGAASFDAMRLSCSELLSILLQADEGNQARFVQLKEPDGLECLLQALAAYKKRDPASSDEAEFVQNLFLSLRAVLLLPQGRDLFRAAEGFELMVRLLKEQRFCSVGAVRVVSFAVRGSRENCLRLVEAGGLRFLFPALMGVGVPRIYLAGGTTGSGTSSSSSSSGGSSAGAAVPTDVTSREVVAAAVTAISSLVLHLHASSELDAGARLASKMSESGCEKALRCVELFSKAARRLRVAEDAVERDVARAVAAGDAEAVQQYSDPDMLYALRLQGGLAAVQQLALVVAYSFLFAESARAPITAALEAAGGGLEDVLGVLREWAANMSASTNAESSDGTGASGAVGGEERITIVQWCAAVAAVLLPLPDN